MTQNHVLWAKATRLLSDTKLFDRERERVLEEYPLLNSYGLGFSERRRQIDAGLKGSPRKWTIERIPEDIDLAREALRTGGQYENGIRNTLVYFVEGRISVSYRLRGCGWARRFNGPAPLRQSSYQLKNRVEEYLVERDRQRRSRGEIVTRDPLTSNGAFICAALMLGLQIWPYQNSIYPDFRLGKPWAVAGLQPQDFGDLQDIHMAKFWRWVAQHEVTDDVLERFVSHTVELLYDGASLDSLHMSVSEQNLERHEIFESLLSEYELEKGESFGVTNVKRSRFGFMAGEISIPDDFDIMGRRDIENLFGLTQ